jgi:hypothetical protein
MKAGYPLIMKHMWEVESKLQGDCMVEITPFGASFPSAYVHNHGIKLDGSHVRMLPPQCPQEMIDLIAWLPVEAEEEKYIF